jgi:5'-nucleotidase
MRRLLLAATLGLITGCYGLPDPPAPTNPLRIILVNDVYVLDTLSDGRGGLHRVAGLRARLEAEGPTLFVLAGDVLSPSLLSKYFAGRQMVDGFNAAGLDYATFGNHEFELDRDSLVQRIAESEFTWVSANCVEATGAAFPGVPAWDTVRIADRLVGIFGVTMQGDYRRYVRCGDPDSAAAAAVAALQEAGAELILALTHQLAEADLALLSRHREIALVLGGHEHEAHMLRVGERHLLKADANSRSAQFATVWGDTSGWRQAVSLVRIDARMPPDTAVARVVAAWTDSLRSRLGGDRPIATTGMALDARDGPLRREERPVGNLITDAMRAGTGADVALINAGTLRLDDVIGPGPVTSYQLESMFLFPDDARVLVFSLSGARLRELLEHGVSERNLGRGGFLQVSGVRFSYDVALPSGSRITGPLRRPDGTPIGAAETLRVAFPVYPACEGGDGYQVPEAAAACPEWRAAPRTVDLLIGYVTDSLGGTITEPAGPRIEAVGR